MNYGNPPPQIVDIVAVHLFTATAEPAYATTGWWNQGGTDFQQNSGAAMGFSEHYGALPRVKAK